MDEFPTAPPKRPPRRLSKWIGRQLRGCQVASLGLMVLVGGCFLVGHIAINLPHAEFTTVPLSLAEYNKRGGHGGLPRPATNIFYARSSRGLGGRLWLYRFDAPRADCIAYGKRLLQEHDGAIAPELTPLTSSPLPLFREMFNVMGVAEIDWFDVETIRSGLEAHREPSSVRPRFQLWIDTDRQRFYFLSSD